MTIFNFGSVNIDYVYRVNHFVSPGETLASESLETVLGGKGANQSVALARAGAPVKHLGKVSSSDKWAKEALAGFGVDVSGLELIDSPSGHAIIQVDAGGENAIILHGGANQSFDEAQLRSLLSDSVPGDWLLLQNECNALEHAFAIAKEKQLHVAFNPAPMHASVAKLPLPQCQLLILNEIEATQLAQVSIADTTLNEAELHLLLQEKYPECTIVLTLGSKGATMLKNNETTSVNAPKVDVIDSTGAGDTFVGYLLAGIIEGLDPQQLLTRACVAGALAVTVAGATPGIPTRAAVDKFSS